MTRTPRDSLLRHSWRSLVILFAAWTVPAVVTTTSIYVIQSGSEQASSLIAIGLRQIWYYWLFAALCPAIYRMIGRLPFSRGQWTRSLMGYVAAGSLVLIGVMILSGLMESLLTLGEQGTPVELIRREFTSRQGQFKAIVHLFYYVATVGAMMIVRLRRQRQREEERAAELVLRASQLETQVTRARLKALEMQLNPHFLFNALNGIASLVQQQRTDQAYDAIVLLGELLRETIDAGDRHTVPLTDELTLLDKYLDLERMRFSDRMRASIDVANDCREAAVPAMILQPLVENAIRHGISKAPEAGLVEIAVREQDSRLVIEVSDDGPGLPDGWTLLNDAGVGLTNLRDRLTAHFETGFDLTVVPARPRGTVARVSLPLRLLRPESS